jgi:hypothetical protein
MADTPGANSAAGQHNREWIGRGAGFCVLLGWPAEDYQEGVACLLRDRGLSRVLLGKVADKAVKKGKTRGTAITCR